MLNIGVSLRCLPQDQLSALTIASSQGHDKIAKLLLQGGASVNYRVCSYLAVHL